MKLNVIIALGACAAMFAACSNEDKQEGPTNLGEIGFTAFTNNTSRSVTGGGLEVTATNLKNFAVYGYNVTAGNAVFEGTVVTRTGTDWLYSPLRYWFPSTEYKFAAIGATDMATGIVPPASLAPTAANDYGTFTVKQDGCVGNNDIVAASATRTTPSVISAQPDKVKLTFNHIMSRVRFQYTTQIAEGYAIEVSNVKVNNTPAEGAYAIGEPNQAGVWSSISGSYDQLYDLTYALDANQPVAGVSLGSGYSVDHYLIPGNLPNSMVNVSFDVTILQGGKAQATYPHSIDLVGVEFQQGHSYNLIAKLDASNINPVTDLYEIQFDVEDVDGWVEEDLNSPEN